MQPSRPNNSATLTEENRWKVSKHLVWPLQIFILQLKSPVQLIADFFFSSHSRRNLYEFAHFFMATRAGASIRAEWRPPQRCSRKLGSCLKVSKCAIYMQLINHLHPKTWSYPAWNVSTHATPLLIMVCWWENSWILHSICVFVELSIVWIWLITLRAFCIILAGKNAPNSKRIWSTNDVKWKLFDYVKLRSTYH